jgi:hypothetical protein
MVMKTVTEVKVAGWLTIEGVGELIGHRPYRFSKSCKRSFTYHSASLEAPVPSVSSAARFNEDLR